VAAVTAAAATVVAAAERDINTNLLEYISSSNPSLQNEGFFCALYFAAGLEVGLQNH
jgi:hypothetical protein